MAKLIESWKDMVGLESEEYWLDINLSYHNGCVRRKSDNDFTGYLSTHTFYGGNYKYSTVLLQEYGFDVQLKNWDGETEEVDYSMQWLGSGKCEICIRKNCCNTKCKHATIRERFLKC